MIAFAIDHSSYGAAESMLLLPVPDLGPQIEPYALSQPVLACDPTEKPGPQAFRNFILERMGGGDFGITRPCEKGKPSDHHLGRGWDWRVSAADPADVARVEQVLQWLLSSDRYGNPAALYRRAGMTYVIWNGAIWTSKTQAWQPYTGPSPHTDHVHFSWSPEGALGQTSLYPWLLAGAPANGTLLPHVPPPRLPVAPLSPVAGILAFGVAAAVGWFGTRALRQTP